MTVSERRNYQVGIVFSIIFHLALVLIAFPMHLLSVPAGIDEIAVGIFEFSGAQPELVAVELEPELAVEPEKMIAKPTPRPTKPVAPAGPRPKNGALDPKAQTSGNLPKAPVSLGDGTGMINGFGQAPYYPKNAVNEGVEGKVLVRALVKTDGSLEAVELVESSGDARLDRAAVNSLYENWVFKPHSEAYYIEVSFSFSLNSGVGYQLVRSATRP
ncbi:MAG: TonB family protein [Firmicutes bacterium]|nr:TonB family protein [Bacillota bacterium]